MGLAILLGLFAVCVIIGVPVAFALGIAAVKARRRVYRCTLAELVEALARAERESRLREKIRYLSRQSLLIVDEKPGTMWRSDHAVGHDVKVRHGRCRWAEPRAARGHVRAAAGAFS